jgi:hypothetical protein
MDKGKVRDADAGCCRGNGHSREVSPSITINNSRVARRKVPMLQYLIQVLSRLAGLSRPAEYVCSALISDGKSPTWPTR